MQLKPTEILRYMDENSYKLPDEAACYHFHIDEKTGGFAYLLFGTDFMIPDIPRGYTLRERNATMLYHLALDHYIDSAEQCAKDHDFGLVLIGSGNEIRRDFDQCDDSSYQAGIGITQVTMTEQIDLFFKMINAEYDHLNRRYKKIRELAEKLRSLP